MTKTKTEHKKNTRNSELFTLSITESERKFPPTKKDILNLATLVKDFGLKIVVPSSFATYSDYDRFRRSAIDSVFA